MKTRLAAALAFLIAPGAFADAGAPEIGFHTGFEYASGDYGLDEDTTTTRIPLGLSADFGRLLVYAELPFVTVEGPAGSVASGSAIAGGAAATRPRLAEWLNGAGETSFDASGIGDASVYASLRLSPDASKSRISAFAGLTLPTGDEEKGLGSGATDTYLGLSADRRFDRFSLFSSAGYVFAGSTDAGSSLVEVSDRDDYAFASFGAGLLVGEASSINLSCSWTQSAYSDLDDLVDIRLDVSRLMSDRVSLGGYVSTTLQGDGEDIGAGLSLSFYPAGD